MKKYKAWLKEEIKNNIQLKLDHRYGLMSGEYIGTHMLEAIINQLDEPEVLSEKWIENHSAKADTISYYSEDNVPVVTVNNLKGLLVPKQELPVIPRFVAEWIEEVKKQNKSMVFAITHIYDKNEIGKTPNKEENRVFQWMESADNEEVFARAWLDGYEVEEEQKYQVIIRDGEYVRLYLCKNNGNVMIGTNDNYIEKCPEVTYLTEQEIKEYDERFWPFAVNIEELGE